MPRVLVGIATYNEIENLPLLVEQIRRYLPDADLFVIDDNSPDGTGAWCERRASQDPSFHCLVRAGKLGLGTAAWGTFEFAMRNDYDWLVNLDADLSHDPKYLPQFMALANRAADSAGPSPVNSDPVDVVVGSRYAPGGSIVGWPRYRRLMSGLINRFARWMLRLPCSDCSGSYRCYRVALLRRLDPQLVVSRGYSFYEEILWHLKRLGAGFAELPIVFTDRRFGESKINAREAWNAARILARLAVREWLGGC